jgi:hypothetical protein
MVGRPEPARSATRVWVGSVSDWVSVVCARGWETLGTAGCCGKGGRMTTTTTVCEYVLFPSLPKEISQLILIQSADERRPASSMSTRERENIIELLSVAFTC